MVLAIDFDGTCVEHVFPSVGRDVPNCVQALKSLINNGHDLILYTMRSDDKLKDAIDWFSSRGIKLYGIQTNPSQLTWSKSPKCYAHKYIDDAALGCPLINIQGFERPVVDWLKVLELLN